jgi:hypothetical protein
MSMFSISASTVQRAKFIIAGALLGLTALSRVAIASGDSALVDVGGKLFDPTNHPLATYSDAEVSLSIVRNDRRLSVFTAPAGQSGSLVALPDDLSQVDQIRRGPGHRAVILGWVSSAVAQVTIFDFKKRIVVDHFWAYQPTLSPNSRWLAFTKYYPPHGAENTEDQYRLYDLARTTAANRPSRPDRGTGAADPVTEVGAWIYPLRANEIDRENVGVDDGTAHESASDFFWSDDSSKLVFADAQAKIMSVVMIRMSTEQEAWIAELRGKVDVCAGDCAGVRMKSVHFSEATLETEFEQIIAGRRVPKTASRIQLPLTDFQPAPR